MWVCVSEAVHLWRCFLLEPRHFSRLTVRGVAPVISKHYFDNGLSTVTIKLVVQ